MMIVEQSHLTKKMDKSGLKMGDMITYKPFFSKKREFELKRTAIHFVTPNAKEGLSERSVKILDPIGREELHVQLYELTIEINAVFRQKRFLIKSILGGPVKLNGVHVMEAYLERGDHLEIGHNSIDFTGRLDSESFDSQLLFLNTHSKLILSTLPILLEGETGTGKSSMVKKIHELSGRPGKLIHINISSFTSTLAESELFGHTKGAFTGAINDKKGAIADAQGGTLFIDEIDSLSLDLQTKLLLFLDEYKIRPVGSEREMTVNTRLVFASGQDLESLVIKKIMRKDFYYRLTGGQKFLLKPLRDDLKKITDFCDYYSMKFSTPFSSKLKDFYCSMPWPGNYRQLQAHLEKKRILGNSSKFEFDQIDEELMEMSSELFEVSQQANNYTMEELKISYASKVYFECDKNFTLTAAKLGMSIRAVKRILKIEKES